MRRAWHCNSILLPIDVGHPVSGVQNVEATERAYHASMTDGVPSNYTLDNYVAHKLSLLTECGARELSTDTNWLNPFILTTVFNVKLEDKMRAYIFNFIRRAEGALSSYRAARSALIEYVNTPRNVVVTMLQGTS